MEIHSSQYSTASSFWPCVGDASCWRDFLPHHFPLPFFISNLYPLRTKRTKYSYNKVKNELSKVTESKSFLSTESCSWERNLPCSLTSDQHFVKPFSPSNWGLLCPILREWITARPWQLSWNMSYACRAKLPSAALYLGWFRFSTGSYKTWI